MEVSHETPVKQPKRLTSVVWNHFERIKNADMLYAVCLHCKKRLCGSSNSGTTHLRNHLLRCLKRSNFDVSQILSSKRKRNEITLPQSMLGQSTLAMNMKDISYEEAKLQDAFISPMPLNVEPEQRREEMIRMSSMAAAKFDQERSNLDLARMIMVHGYPLAMVDHAGFKIFVKGLQPMFEINNDTIESNCMNIFSKEKQKMYETIHHFHGRINLAIDIWGSAESSGYICVTANYVDEEWRLQKKMLNFMSLSPLCTDDMLSEAVIKSLTGWSIDRKLFSMTFDDCSSREIMVFKIKEWLSQNRPLLKNDELFDMRCITHLSKSIVQEILGASGGLIHKIRESIKHVTSTQAILGKFNELAQQAGINTTDRHLTLDCRMWWNTTYMMLEAALGYRAAFSQLSDHDPAYLTPLSETEWEWASAISSYMKVLLEFTNVFVGNKCPTSNLAFAELCDLHMQLNEWCKNDDDYLNSVASRMKNKFDTYWNKCSLAIAIAAILDPRYKMKLVEYYYLQIYGADASDHIKEVGDGLRELFTEYSMGSHLLDPDSAWPGGMPSSSSNIGDKLEGFDRFLCQTSQSQSISSDLDKYLEEPVFPRNYDFNILNWWKVHTPRYPVLSMMASDMLAISVSTLGPEVAFSNSGRVLDQHLTSLSPDIREALLCGQNWLKVEQQATSIPLLSSP